MKSYLKPLKAGKPRGATTPYERIGEDEKPFLAEGVDHNPKLILEDQKLKRRIRWLKFVSRLLAFVISLGVAGMMGNTAISYYSSKSVESNGMSPWPETPKLWPTIMMVSISVISVIGNAAVLISYCCGQKASNKVDSIKSFIDRIIHISGWTVTAVLFKMQCGKGGDHDLWAWTCSTTADDRQEEFKHVVNYDFLCMTNTTSWYISLANVGFGLLSFIIFVLAIRRVKSKKKINAAQATGSIHIPQSMGYYSRGV